MRKETGRQAETVRKRERNRDRETETERDREADRQTDRQTDKQTDRQTGRQSNQTFTFTTLNSLTEEYWLLSSLLAIVKRSMGCLIMEE